MNEHGYIITAELFRLYRECVRSVCPPGAEKQIINYFQSCGYIADSNAIIFTLEKWGDHYPEIMETTQLLIDDLAEYWKLTHAEKMTFRGTLAIIAADSK